MTLMDWPCWRGLLQRCWRCKSPFCCLLCHNANGQGPCVAPVLQLRLMAQGLGMVMWRLQPEQHWLPPGLWGQQSPSKSS